MHNQRLEIWEHRHNFNLDKRANENRTRIVVAITFVTMVAEIIFGWLTNSMALYADGWHMGTHAAALGITLFAYRYARRHANNPTYTFGTGKISVLGGFTSAVVLSIVALLMAGESVHRLFVPLEIHFNEAIGIACIGLLVNLGCAVLLADRHPESDGGSAHRADLNLRAAYLHVLADALTRPTATAGR